METTYKLHTDKTYMKNTYLIKKDGYGVEVFIIVNGQNIKLAHNYVQKISIASAVNFVKSIENFVSIEHDYDLKTNTIKTRVDFEYSVYMHSMQQYKYIDENPATSNFRIVNPENSMNDISIFIEKKVDCGVLIYAA